MFLTGSHLHEGVLEFLRWEQNLPSFYPNQSEMDAETYFVFDYCVRQEMAARAERKAEKGD